MQAPVFSRVGHHGLFGKNYIKINLRLASSPLHTECAILSSEFQESINKVCVKN